MKSLNGIVRYGQAPEVAFTTHNDKFPQEKVCFEDEDYLIHFDGILLNSAALEAELNCRGNKAVLLQLYQQHGAELVLHTKGLFALLLWDKKAEKLLITNDLLSKRPVYYHIGKNGLCYGASYYDLLDRLSHTDFVPTVRHDALQDMLKIGFLTGSKTYLEDVHFLNAFESLVVDLAQQQTQLLRHPMKHYEIPADEDGIVDRFDQFFSDAVRLQFKKNAQYGYLQCTTLSGGMDSRACLLQARRLGFDKDIVCFNYAQSGSLDHSISQQIAADLGVDYLHYPMDAAVFVERLQDAMDGNECMQSGIGATGARTMATLLNTDRFGLVSVGICGGELMGDLVVRNRTGEPGNKLLRFAYRAVNKLKEQFSDEIPQPGKFSFDHEEYLKHLRASKNFANMFVDKCECVSPFMDEDVAMFILQLNPGLLFDRRIYRKWMIKYLPNSYLITSTCARIDSSLPEEMFAKLRYHVLLRHNGVSRWSMNPIDHWFAFRPEHAKNRSAEYAENRLWLQQQGCPEAFLSAMEQGWQSDWLRKLYVLTAQRALKDIFTRFEKIQ